MNAPVLNSQSIYEAQASFVAELATRLHAYGTTSQRLEGAVMGVAQRLGLECEVWSNPTGIILSFADPVRGQQNGITRVLRLAPGDQNLGRLAATDAIAEDVLAGRMDPGAGLAALKALDRPASRTAQALNAFSFGLSAAAVAALLGAAWAGVATAGVIGIVIGVMFVLGAGRPRLSEALEAIAALVATLLAAAVATWIAPLSLNTVIISSLIVLMPGLMLTNAVSELSSQQLMSGTARFAGALMILMKLTFGTVAAMQIVGLLGWVPQEAPAQPLAPLAALAALGVAAYAFAVLFQASARDYPLVMAAVLLGYGLTRVGGEMLGLASDNFAGGAFFASMGVAVISNLYGRWRNRPGALIRVPGIILLVPGSVGFRSLNFVMERDVWLGLDTAFVLLSALIAIVAGLLFGNLIIPSRRNI
ncbi:MAG TPA: threonine/serine exporter family protein [Arenimonas sp.]|uniref:threonine/serine ThrE exporter family protein n=1 Tax=Arenimonas sp. TaxID=1872635 RepID=UPI002D7F47BA|nr:threonine/serine exporter family protein [Arenimonas sp.]HEU0154366.1 threonine/serine exporter family protein [Arenimonas sp.]